MSMTIGQVLASIRQRLTDAGVAEPALDARVLVSGLLGLDRTALVLRSGDPVDDDALARIEAALAERLSGKPVYRILGRRGFHEVELTLSPATLEPRPDTEILVDAVLTFMHQRADGHGAVTLIDLGTGTGAIALALLAAEPRARALATDMSAEALLTAQANAALNGLSDRFSTVKADWFEGVDGRFDLIVSNPPYIASAEVLTLDREVLEHDPLAALDGGPDGLDAYRALAEGAADHLADGGLVGLEIGHDQKASVTALFTSHGFRLVEARADLAGRDRVLLFDRP